MVLQTEYNNPHEQELGLPGELAAGVPHEILTVINDYPRAKQIIEAALSYSNGNDYSLTINGYEFKVTADDGDVDLDSADDLVTQLAEDINGDHRVNGSVKATADLSGDLVKVEARHGGTGFTYTSNGNVTVTETQSNDESDPVPMGRAVLRTGMDTEHVLGRLADATGLTKRNYVVTVDTVTNGRTYAIMIRANGRVYQIKMTADGTATEDEILNDLSTQIGSVIPSYLVTSSVDTAPTPSELTIEAGVAGSDFTLEYLDELMSEDSFTEGDVLADILAGFSVRQDSYETAGSDSNDAPEYPANSEMSVGKVGHFYLPVEGDITDGDEPWVRMAADGTKDTLGGLAGSGGAGLVKLQGAEFVSTNSDGVAKLRLRL